MSLENAIVGEIRLEGVNDDICIENIADLIDYINKNAKFYLPGNATNPVVGPSQPTDADRHKIWFRTDNSSNFKGIYVFSVGGWRKIYPVGENQVFWILGDSREPPPGYKVIDEGIGGITSGEVDRIKALYQSDVNNEFFTYFAVVFRGF